MTDTETSISPERAAAIEAELAALRAPKDVFLPQPPPLTQTNAEIQNRQDRARQDRLKAAERAEERASLEARRLAPQIEAAEAALRGVLQRIEEEHAAHEARLAEIAAERRTIAGELAALLSRVEAAKRNDVPGEE